MFTVSLSTIYSISKTLGPELEILSNLNITERFHFLYLLKKSIINENVIGRITSKSKIFNDPFELLRYRKGVSLQSRSLMLATSLFLPHSIVMGLYLKKKYESNYEVKINFDDINNNINKVVS